MRFAVAFILMLFIAMTLSTPGKERYELGEEEFGQTEINDQGNNEVILNKTLFSESKRRTGSPVLKKLLMQK